MISTTTEFLYTSFEKETKADWMENSFFFSSVKSRMEVSWGILEMPFQTIAELGNGEI